MRRSPPRPDQDSDVAVAGCKHEQPADDQRRRDAVPDWVSLQYVDLNVSTRQQDDHVVVATTGEIDLHTAPRLQADLAELMQDGSPRLIVDLSGVEFCDSTGVNVLLAAMRRAHEQGGSLSLVSPQAAVRKVLGITGLDSVFPVRESVEEAIRMPPEPGT